MERAFMSDITFNTPEAQEVWNTLRALNDCWTKEDGIRLTEYFHKDMVAITPVDKLRREGQQACLDGWIGFAKATHILYWKEIDPKVQVYGNAAVVSYYFDMAFEMNGNRIESKGRDMLFFIKENGKWLAVADQFSPYP
jgi:ketosteroid isomerase-like protein